MSFSFSPIGIILLMYQMYYTKNRKISSAARQGFSGFFPNICLSDSKNHNTHIWGIKEVTKLACSGIMRTSINDPISEATPSCWYRRTIATVIRNGADHSPWSCWHICYTLQRNINNKIYTMGAFYTLINKNKVSVNK